MEHGLRHSIWYSIMLIPLVILFAVSCSTPPPAGGAGLAVVATTTIVGDVVAQVGGEHISLTVLLPVDADPHSFDPAPQDMAAIERAQLVFINGLGLEENLERMVRGAAQDVQVMTVSDGIDTIAFGGQTDQHDEDHHGGADPHVWNDPRNVMVWAENIAEALGQADPPNASAYRENADSYIAALAALHSWIEGEVATLAPDRRTLVTDHTAFGYFAQAYGFTQVGAVIPGTSTLAEPSAQQLAELEDAIRQYQVPAIFVGTTVNTNLAERVASDTGIELVPLYTGSLSDADGPAASYIELMHYNVRAIVEALQ